MSAYAAIKERHSSTSVSTRLRCFRTSSVSPRARVASTAIGRSGAVKAPVWARRSRSLGDVESAAPQYRRAAALNCGSVRCCSCSCSAIQVGVGSQVVAAMMVGAAVAQEFGTNAKGQPLACSWQAEWMDEPDKGCTPAGYRHVNGRKGV